MSKWDDFRKKMGEFADKTVTKTRELTDSAALKIKIGNKEADRDTEYKNLGKLTYTKLRNPEGGDGDEITALIAESLDRLDKICRDLEKLKEEQKDRQNAKEQDPGDKKESNMKEKDAKKASKVGEEELDMGVMEEFKQARETADEEYEKAKKAAEDVK